MKHQLFLLFSLLALQNTECRNAEFELLGYPIASPIGVSACPLTTSDGIKNLATLGYDVITYKTIRSSYWPTTSSTIYEVDIQAPLTRKDFYATFRICDQQNNQAQTKSLTNCYGNSSCDKETTIADIAQARSYLSEKQVLIVSIYGSGHSDEQQINDFVAAARIAVAGGAHILEANLSCPNLTNNEYRYKDANFVYHVCRAITAQFPLMPLIIKVGFFDTIKQTKEVLLAACAGGARGICGINTMPAHIVDASNNPAYGSTHTISGVSGAPLFNLMLEFVKNARTVIDQEKLPLTLLATGGITEPKDFDAALAAGADIALCATGAMKNKNLAVEYHALHQSNCSAQKTALIKELYAIGAIKAGNFTLKSGMQSPIYFDMRLLISYPKLLRAVASECAEKMNAMGVEVLCGVPYAAVPLATLISSLSDIPLIMPRKEVKSHGTKKAIEGEFKPQDRCIVIEDVVVSGASIFETIKILEDHTLHVNDIVVLIDREQGGVENIESKGYKVHALFTISEILHVLLADGLITDQQCATIKNFCANNRTDKQA